METKILQVNPEQFGDEEFREAGQVLQDRGLGGVSDRDGIWSWRKCHYIKKLLIIYMRPREDRPTTH